MRARLGWGRALATVVRMELQQRLRTRSWYIMLAVWFIVIGLVTWGAFANFNVLSGREEMDVGAGRFVFEAVVGFVLLFGLLVAPAVSANTISGDRAGGTLAVVQVTLLTPGQLLVGKWLASWAVALAFLGAALPYVVVSMFLRGLDVGELMAFVVMVALELGVVCAIGAALSAVASRTLFAVVATYLVVALFSLGTLIAFALTVALTQTTVQANVPEWTTDPESPGAAPDRCTGRLQPVPAADTRATYWILAANPFVVVSDAVPTPDPVPAVAAQEAPPEEEAARETTVPDGLMTVISRSVRHLQRPPEMTVPCANGEPADPERATAGRGTPVWPLGLGLQVVVAGGLFVWARSRLAVPAARLPRGTRVA